MAVRDLLCSPFRGAQLSAATFRRARQRSPARGACNPGGSPHATPSGFSVFCSLSFTSLSFCTVIPSERSDEESLSPCCPCHPTLRWRPDQGREASRRPPIRVQNSLECLLGLRVPDFSCVAACFQAAILQSAIMLSISSSPGVKCQACHGVIDYSPCTCSRQRFPIMLTSSYIKPSVVMGLPKLVLMA